MTCDLYRHFDAEGRLLYVGISASAVQRLAAHKIKAPWASQISKVTVDHFATRPDALFAEQVAIRLEAPLHNIKGATGTINIPEDFEAGYALIDGEPSLLAVLSDVDGDAFVVDFDMDGTFDIVFGGRAYLKLTPDMLDAIGEMSELASAWFKRWLSTGAGKAWKAEMAS